VLRSAGDSDASPSEKQPAVVGAASRRDAAAKDAASEQLSSHPGNTATLQQQRPPAQHGAASSAKVLAEGELQKLLSTFEEMMEKEDPECNALEPFSTALNSYRSSGGAEMSQWTELDTGECTV